MDSVHTAEQRWANNMIEKNTALKKIELLVVNNKNISQREEQKILKLENIKLFSSKDAVQTETGKILNTVSSSERKGETLTT